MWMKKIKMYVDIAVLSAGMTFCAGCIGYSLTDSGQGGIGAKPITLISGMGQSRSANVGLQSVQIVKDVKAGAFVTSGSQTITGNAELTADGNGGLEGNVGNYPETGTVSVYAYAPYNGGWTLDGDNSFSIAEDQSTDEGYLASDLLWGVPLGDNSFGNQDDAIFLNFKHLLSKVNVRVDKGTSNIGLADASISIVGVKNTVSFNVMSGEIGDASGEEGGVKIVTSEAGNTNFKGSAIVVPQQVNAGQFFRITTADGQIVNASLPLSVDFESGKAYTYTIRLVGSGDKVVATVVTDYSISDWNDDVTVPNEGWENGTYGVGDYVLRDGSLMKAEDAQALDDEMQNYVAAVIFSTNVSPEDAAAGYVGYAVSVGGRRASTTWRIPQENETTPLLRQTQITEVADAFDVLDGVTITGLAQRARDGGIYDAFDFTNYSYVNSLKGKNLSGWFVPSLGQMTQLFNNLGKADILVSSIDKLNGYGEFTFGGIMSSIVSNVNSYNIGDAKILREKGSDFYISSTEYDNGRVWGYTMDMQNGNLKLHSVAGKAGGGRNVICCVAYKIPSE